MSDLPKSVHCPYCETVIDAVLPLNENHLPKAGNLSFCLNCEKIAIFTEELDLRKMTEAEGQEIESNFGEYLAEVREKSRFVKGLFQGLFRGTHENQ